MHMTTRYSHSKHTALLSGLIGLLCLISAPTAFAATADQAARVYFETPVVKVAPSSLVTVSVFVDAPEAINSVDLQIAYPSDMLEFVRSDNAHSVVSFWKSGPALLQIGHIRLTGGMLKPFSGEKGLVATMTFHALVAGTPSLSFERANFYKADGEGTKITPSNTPLSFTIINGTAKTEVSTPVTQTPTAPSSPDTTAPDVFLGVTKDPVGGLALVVFRAEDPESGIAKTEMRTMQWFSWSGWQSVQNPTPYPGGSWSLELRATNGAGLSTVKTLSSPFVLVKKFGLELLALILIVFFSVRVYNKKKTQQL